MDALGMKPSALAVVLGVSETAVYAWIAGDYRPGPARYPAVAEALSCAVGEVALAAAGIESTLQAADLPPAA